jgi:cob(I)alamin adenosyltransferase
MKIYTKKGDQGSTGLIGGTRVSKGDVRIEAYGTIDELNSYIGLIACLDIDVRMQAQLHEIQDRLFTIGSSLACDPEKAPAMKIPDLKESDVSWLENEIDRMNEFLPEMKFFILPGGHPTVSTIHICRCVCRRAERIAVHLHEEQLFVDPLVIKYLNRLSDYLFVLSRYAAHLLQVPEMAWRPRINGQ